MDETAWICQTCGVQYPPAVSPPDRCPICEDPRQYVGPNGQQWTTLDRLRQQHHNGWVEEEAGACWSVRTEPPFAIGQRAYLIRTPEGEGNILWDCITLLDEPTVHAIRERGGVRAIAISHPHYYSTMAEWSRVLGDVPIYIHADDRQWVQRKDNVEFWTGETKTLLGNLTLIRSGGHFTGYQVLHWPAGAGGRGALMAGDQPQVCPDRRWVAFLYSYPNMIPFDAATIEQIDASLRPFAFERIYGAFGRNVLSGAKEAVQRSKERYLRAIGAIP